jgi:hypothetical protein
MDTTKKQIIDDLIDKLTGPAEVNLGRAYEAGRVAGYEAARSELVAEMQDKMLSLFNTAVAPQVNRSKPASAKGRSKSSGRAESGTVRPAMQAAMTKANKGLRPGELTKLLHASGFVEIKEATVRATLNKWKAKGMTTKRDDLWYYTGEGTNKQKESGGKQPAYGH